MMPCASAARLTCDKKHWLGDLTVRHIRGEAECSVAEKAASVPVMSPHGFQVAINHGLQRTPTASAQPQTCHSQERDAHASA